MKNFIIPIFIPHWGCPHQCVFCSQNSITGCSEPTKAKQVGMEIETGLKRLTEERYVEVAYYGGSFTALPLTIQAELLQPAYQSLQSGRIQGIRLSTRPDYISSDVITLLQQYSVSTVELGIQSFDDSVLTQSGRGHNAVDSVVALKSLRIAGFNTVAQLMIGLPGESWDSVLKTATMLAQTRPDGVRIYPTVVLSDTPLATLYRTGRYQPLSLAEATAKAAFLKWQAERHGINVIRVGLQATDELSKAGAILAGPYHPAFGEMVSSHLFYLMVAHLFESVNNGCHSATIHHHPRDHSKLRGIANANLGRWRNSFGISVICQSDSGISEGDLMIEYADTRYIIKYSILSDV
ncbi:hypothetical protein AXX12_04160 [Anaerosporomusa subterranea]|uniref:Radical SAM core domain-containing protein n=1 Tax=Anaerosporomusa subterranea TaxID=1794912 RepID=A0A154BTJ5_ANASB|nr:radical SAM protein [Anaerosporomusa subterranea]KYZ77333.1 hypothetical protein AXX12_04160 [Anaerosporomusa subterranea]